jgi:uncharacterized protein DUF3303
MKFIVELRLKPGCKNRAVEAFEARGPNRFPGVNFREAWIGKHSDVAFVLLESADEQTVVAAAKTWTEFGDCQITEVIAGEDF